VESRSDAITGLPAALAISVLVFAWPDISLAIRGVPGSYPIVTAIFTLAVVALVVAWPRDSSHRPAGASTERPGPLVAAATASAAAAVVIVAAYRWMRLVVWYPYHADMLIVIREATQRFLSGHSPYTTYRSYDTTWNMAMPPFDRSWTRVAPVSTQARKLLPVPFGAAAEYVTVAPAGDVAWALMKSMVGFVEVAVAQ